MQPKLETTSEKLALMRHDIRNHLNAIVGLAKILAASDTPVPKQKEMILTLQSSTENLGQVIRDMFDLCDTIKER